MTHTKWRSDGHPTGFRNRVLSLSSPTAHGLMATLMRASARVWQRSSVQFTSCTCGGISGRKGNGRVVRVERYSVAVHAPQSAIMILVKNPNATHEGCKIHYRDIGDYLTREQKLEALTEAVSIKGYQRLADNHAKYRLRLGWTTQRSVCSVLSTRIYGYKGRQSRRCYV